MQVRCPQTLTPNVGNLGPPVTCRRPPFQPALACGHYPLDQAPNPELLQRTLHYIKLATPQLPSYTCPPTPTTLPHSFPALSTRAPPSPCCPQRQPVPSVRAAVQRAAPHAYVWRPAASGRRAAGGAAWPCHARGQDGEGGSGGGHALADGAPQVVDKRSSDRCCFEKFVAVVGLCADVRDLYGTACWIFQKVAARRLACV
jgi:hypothetical protein